MIYFDNAATTSVCDSAVKAAASALAGAWGNPSSYYSLGIEAEKLLEISRKTVAGALKVPAEDVYFTSCGTESNNLAVMGLAGARANWGRRIVATAYEHPSVENCLRALEESGFEVVRISPENGEISIDRMLCAVNKETALVTAMAVNNETGAIIDIPALAREVKRINPRAAFHCDFVQGFMKRESPVTADVTSLSVSGHKIHAPKGVGALYLKKGTNIKKYLHGGGQEHSLRPGTENVAYAAALAAAISDYGGAIDPMVKQTVLDGVKAVPGVIINSPVNSDASILNFSLVGYRSETVLHFLESRGIMVSSGSACSRGEKSHTLTAMGLPARVIDGAVRVSFSPENTVEEAKIFVKELAAAQQELAHF